jgi:hypothetical protein
VKTEEKYENQECFEEISQNKLKTGQEFIEISGDFECSNINLSIKNEKDDLHYMILNRSDTNTSGCLHWFNFQVRALKPCTIKFTIMNNTRNGLFYHEGMRINTWDSL